MILHMCESEYQTLQVLQGQELQYLLKVKEDLS